MVNDIIHGQDFENARDLQSYFYDPENTSHLFVSDFLT